MEQWTDSLEYADPEAQWMSDLEYQTFLIKMENDDYIPSEHELSTDFTTKKHCFFVVRRKNMNHIIYYDNTI